MKKYKVYSEELGYEQIIEADNDEQAINMGYDEVSNNLHEYIEININELESEDQWKNNMYFGKKFKKQ